MKLPAKCNAILHKMKYEKSTLSNGIRVVSVSMPSFKSATIDVWVNVGSRHEPSELSGISHFLEHVVLDGGKKYPTSASLWGAIDNVGGDLNAATSRDYTNYYAKVHVDHLRLGFDILSDVLTNTRFALKDIKKERSVILDEIARGNDSPRSIMFDNFYELIFKGHPLSRPIIGTKKIIKNMNRADVVRYKEKYYVTENIVISCAGGISHSEVVSLAESYFGSLKSDPSKNNSSEQNIKYSLKNRLKIFNKDTEQTNVVIGFPGLGLFDPRRYAESVLSVILGSGASSRLFLKIREQHALAYSVGSTASHYQGGGYFGAYAGTAPKNATKALSLMLNEHSKFLSKTKAKLTKDEFKKSISFIKGHTALGLESSQSVSAWIGFRELFLEEIETPEEYLKEIEKVSPEEVFALAKDIFDFEKMVVSIVGPHRKENDFRKIVS